MNEQQQLIKDTLDRLLTDLCTKDVVDAAEAGQWPEALWNALTETGLTVAGIPESAAGSGGDIEDSLLVIREAARHAAPLPLAEHFIAASLLAEAGASVPAEPMTIAQGDLQLGSDNQVTGELVNVAFARWCTEVIAIADRDGSPVLCRIPLSLCTVSEGSSLAGEPRDHLVVNGTLDESQVLSTGMPTAADAVERMNLMGAACRTLMMAGALESVLEMSVQYSLERSQFGRPISKFQAIQQQLAALAGEVAASTMAAHAVSAAFASLDVLDIAIGKARVGESVGTCTDIAHQVHGAMGYTMEHALNHRTRRLWGWREDYGSEPVWQKLAGSLFLAKGADGLWPAITERR